MEEPYRTPDENAGTQDQRRNVTPEDSGGTQKAESWLPAENPPAYTYRTGQVGSKGETSWFSVAERNAIPPDFGSGQNVPRPPRPMPPVPPAVGYSPPAAYPPPPYPAGNGYGPPAPPSYAENPEVLRAVIAGRPFTPERGDRLTGILQRRDTAYWMLTVVQMVLFTVLAQLLIWPRRNIGDMIIAWAVMALSVAAFFILWKLQAGRMLRIKGDAGELPDHVTEIYGDRIVIIRAEGRAVMRFSRIRWVEEDNGLLAVSDSQQLFQWAEEDLTAYDYALLKRTLLQAVPAFQWRVRRPLVPRLAEPLPLPVFAPPEREKQVRLTCPPGTVRWALLSREQLPRVFQKVAMLLPALAALGSVCGFTVYYAVDIVIFALILTALVLIMEGGISILRSRALRRSGLRITLVPQGAAIQLQESTWLFTPAELRPSAGRGGISFTTPWGRLRLKYEAAENPDALRAWFGRGPTGGGKPEEDTPHPAPFPKEEAHTEGKREKNPSGSDPDTPA